jgi:hypothetical protein
MIRDITEATRFPDEKDVLIARHTQAGDEIKVIHGVLLICMRCKKVRNDKGSWQRLDEYIDSRSSVKFSHGYCPECAEEVLREVYKTSNPG